MGCLSNSVSELTSSVHGDPAGTSCNIDYESRTHDRIPGLETLEIAHRHLKPWDASVRLVRGLHSEGASLCTPPWTSAHRAEARAEARAETRADLPTISSENASSTPLFTVVHNGVALSRDVGCILNACCDQSTAHLEASRHIACEKLANSKSSRPASYGPLWVRL